MGSGKPAAGHGQDVLGPVGRHRRCPSTHRTGEVALCPVERRGTAGKEVGPLFQGPSVILPREKNPTESGVVPGAFVSHQCVHPITCLLCICYISATVYCICVSPCIYFRFTMYLFCIYHESPLSITFSLCIHHVSAVYQILLQIRIRRIFWFSQASWEAALTPPFYRLVRLWQGGDKRGGCRDLCRRESGTAWGRGSRPPAGRLPRPRVTRRGCRTGN